MDLSAVKQEFFDHFGNGEKPEHVFFAPGRVCLIGEHIDYNGGVVLPAALSLGVYGIYRSNDSGKIKMKTCLDETEIEIDLNEPIQFRKEYGWGNYPIGVIKYLKNHGMQVEGGELYFKSNLPTGAGLSSSAAIEVLTGFLFSSLNGENRLSNEELAILCKDVENEFVGVQCGIMDQFAVAMGKKGHAVKVNCSTLEHEYVPVRLEQHELVIFNTNKKRELTDSHFNTRTQECKEAYEQISKHKDIENLVDATLEDVDRYIDDPVIKKRAKHVITENKRVSEAVDALRRNDIEHFGQLLYQTHDSLKHNYEVTGLELDTIEETARLHPSCVGAKMSGAGFGGCAFAIVEKDDAENVITHVLEEYYKQTGLNADYYIAEIEDGVRRINQ